MKKLFIVLSLMLTFTVFTNIQSVKSQISQPWIDIGVAWTDNCLGPVNSHYIVTIDISDVCKMEGIHYDTQKLSLNESSTTFSIPQICTHPSQYHPCYRVTITLQKIQTANGAVLCSTSTSNDYNCLQLENLDGEIFNLAL